MNVGNGLSEGILGGCERVERRLVRMRYMQIATQMMTRSTEPHPLN